MTPKHYRSFAIAFICSAYVSLRFWGLTSSCLWFDEIFSVHAAAHPWNSIFWFAAQDLAHPPLFYVLLKWWIAVGGEGLFWLRSFPVILSILALYPFLQLCKELKLKFPAIAVAAALFAVNGSLIKYAQEVRMYSLLLFLGLMSLWLFARFFYRGKNIWVLTIVNILLVYTHYFGWFTVAAEILAIVIFQRVKIRHVLVMAGITVTAYIPWVAAIVRASNAGSDIAQNIGWIERPGFKRVVEFLVDTVEPFYFQASSGEPSTLAFVTVPLIVLISIAAVIYFAKWRQRESHSTFYLLALCCGVPAAGAFALSWLLPYSIWGSRHLIVAFPVAAVLVASFFDAIPSRVLKGVLTGGITIVSIAAFTVRMQQPKPEYIWCEWAKAAAAVPDDKPASIFVFEELAAYHIWFAMRGTPAERTVLVQGSGVPEDKAFFLPRGFDAIEKADGTAIAGDEIWVAFRTHQYHEKHPPLSIVLEKGYRPAETKKFGSGPEKVYLVRAFRNK